LAEPLMLIAAKVLSVPFISCRWAGVQKAITSLFKKLQNLLWQKDGGSPQDSTLVYSEMPGELDKTSKYFRGIHTEEQFNNLRKDL
jgi:hypothetical protein